MSALTIKDLYVAEELSAEAARNVKGGNPVLVYLAGAAAGYLGGKLIDGIVEDSGILDPVVDYKDDGIHIGGQKV